MSSANPARQAREALGARLREIRKDAGLTAKAFAGLAGWHFTEVSKLGQHVQRAHLSIPEFAARFRAAAIECGEGEIHVSERQAKRWLAGEAEMPRPVCRRILEHWWREPVSRLLGPPESGAIAPAVAMTDEELIMNAGRESTEHALNAAAALDPSALEHLHSAARRLARAWCSIDSVPGEIHRSSAPARHRIRAAGPHSQARPASRAVPIGRTGLRPTFLGELGPQPPRSG
jgi:transcriptional regulator with XRE-family HTH domain